MSKSKLSGPVVQTPAQPSMVTTQNAIYILNNKIQKLEEVVKRHMTDIEQKFGDHESYVTDNIPDLDLINKAISCINNRLLDVDALEARVAALEGPNTPKLDLAPRAQPPASKKKGGTVKLAEMTPLPEDQPGISFS